MAENEPGTLFRYGRPVEGAFVDAVEMREYFEALARTHYTTDAGFPQNARDGQPRINAVDPNNIKLQVWLSGAWRTVVQQVDKGIAAPVKSIWQFDTPGAAWVIDHNLESQPVVQVFDTLWNQLTPVPVTDPPNDEQALGFIPQGLLTALVGTQQIASFNARHGGFITGLYFSVAESVTGAPDITFDLLINGTPVTGGVITLSGPQGVGDVLNATPITADNQFADTDLIQLRSQTVATPLAGSLTAMIVTQRDGYYYLNHVNENRVTVNHPVAKAGFAVVVG